MRICFFSEGSYPHVPGGVSSWVNMMIRSFPEHEFIIYAIGAEKKMRGDFAYELPDNVIEVREVFLDELQFVDAVKKRKRFSIPKKHKEELVKLLQGEAFDWNVVFAFFEKFSTNDVAEFFLSRPFFDMIKEVYHHAFQFTPFTEFVWTIRSMYLPLFFLLSQDMPKADIYHSVSCGYGGVLASYASVVNNKPFILSEHGIYTREREEEIIQATWIKSYYKSIWIAFFKNFSRCAYDHAAKVTSLFSVNRTLQIELGCPEEKIRIIPNGIDVSRFDQLTYEPIDGQVTIGAIVRIVPIKDIKTLLQAFAMVKKTVSNAVLYVIGPIEESPEYYEECMQMLKILRLEDVHFTGRVNIFDYLPMIDIMVLTSISEGQPLAVMEAMAAKKPVVATNVGACSQLLHGIDDDTKKAGFVEYVMDYEMIATRIIELVNHPEWRQIMGQNGYDRISKYYQKDDVIDQYRALYLEVSK